MARNPIEIGKGLLDEYRNQLFFVLEENDLPREAIQQILARMQIDSGIYLSLNPRYEQTNEPFANFVQQHNLPKVLVSLLPRLSEGGLFTHQKQGILSILANRHTIVSTGTGSGKTETFLIPILSHCLQTSEKGVKAIIVYPMNALAGDQVERIGNYTRNTNITFGLYTGATPENSSFEQLERKFRNQLIYRDEIRANPPDILITNYVMLDRMLTRPKDHRIFTESSCSMRYLVLDELHTYTGSKAAHLKYLLARLRYYFINDIIYIGTSATLVSSTAGKKRLDQFVADLFEIAPDSYTFIESTIADEQQASITPVPLRTDADLESVDFSSEEKAADSIFRLTGERVDQFEFYTPPNEFHNTRVYQALKRNSGVAAIYDALRMGAQSFSDLVGHISQVIPSQQFDVLAPDKLLNAYLKAISYINEKAGEQGKPLMDYRIHVLVHNITGNLKTCPVCEAYFSGDLSYCPHDGYPLFAVYRRDIRHFVGKFNGQHLRPVVEPESTDPQNTHYVLISKASNMPIDEFDMLGDITRDGQFEINPRGAFRLAHLEVQNYEQLENDLIWLADERCDYLYLYYLVRVLLQSYGKSLGFVDNREKASHHSTILRDEFADEFLQAFLQLYYPRERQLDLSRTLDYLQKKAASVGHSDLEIAIFSELAPWYYRYISVPERLGGTKGLLRLRDGAHDWQALSDLQRELLAIFLQERALSTDYTDENPDGRFVRFQRFWAISHYGIFIEDTLSEDPLYRGISLGEHSREYADFVQKWSTQAIQKAAHELVDVGILVRRSSPDNKAGYYLNLEYVCFNLPLSQYGEGDEGYERLKKERLFVAEVHSSDLRAAERTRVENGLKRGDIHFVVATPTLEMGIDIGDLESVLMIGAPPTPANYAQRAGRAGRGKKHEALIVTYCWGTSAHDMYMFRNPAQMINGQVHPPAFNPDNPDLIKKHVNAFVLRNHLQSRDTLRQFALTIDAQYKEQMPQLRQLFGERFPYEQYLGELRETVEHVLTATDGKQISLANFCYDEAIFPDYSFRRDQVIAVDVEDKDKLTSERTLDWNDYALTTRDLEQAFRFFIPDQTMYVAGEVYKTLYDGIYDLLPDGARQYTCFFAEKERWFAQRHKEIKHLDTRQHFIPAMPTFVDKRGVLAIGYTDECLLSFRNYGVRRDQKQETDTAKKILIGYDLKREAVILRFDSLVCSEELRNSLVAALIREVNEFYGLATGEIRLMLDAKLVDASDERWIYVLLYDNDGNHNLRLSRIVSDFDTLIHHAYERLTECECKTDGCYHCIKNYNMQHCDQTLSKKHAEMFTGFLLGKRRFEPDVLPYEPPQPVFDLILNVRSQKNEIVVTRDAEVITSRSVGDDLNSAIFLALEQAIYSQHQPGMASLGIETWVDWLADAINNRSINKGKEAFNRLQFALLGFKQVKAIHKPTKGKVSV